MKRKVWMRCQINLWPIMADDHGVPVRGRLVAQRRHSRLQSFHNFSPTTRYRPGFEGDDDAEAEGAVLFGRGPQAMGGTREFHE